jgi:hypothetical protein
MRALARLAERAERDGRTGGCDVLQSGSTFQAFRFDEPRPIRVLDLDLGASPQTLCGLYKDSPSSSPFAHSNKYSC